MQDIYTRLRNETRTLMRPTHQNIYLLMKIATLAIVVVSFFYTGLFWVKDRVYFQMALAFLATVWLFVRPHKDITLTATDFLLFGLIATYSVGLVRPATMYGAVNTLLLWVTYAIVFLLFKDFDFGEKGKAAVLKGLVLLSSVIAVLGLASYTGVLTLTDAARGGRLQAVLQYPNATAAVLVLGAIAALSIVPTVNYKRQAQIGFMSLVLMLTALLLTYSRGGWLCFLVCAPIACLSSGRTGTAMALLCSALIVSAALFGLLVLSPSGVGFVGVMTSAIVLSWFYERVDAAALGLKVFAALSVTCVVGALGWAFWGPERYAITCPTTRNFMSISFVVEGLEPESEVSLNTQVSFRTPSETGSARLVVSAIRPDGTRAQIARKDVAEGGLVELTGMLPEDTSSVRVELSNSKAGTTVVFSNPTIKGSKVIRLSSPVHKLVPAQLTNRIAQLDYDVIVNDGRFTFLRDGWRAFLRAPLLGRGGGTWQVVYPAYQSSAYSSTRAHSEPLEMLLDVGVLGYGLFLLLVGICFFASYRRSMIDRASIVACAYILLHSAFEILGAYPSIYLVFFALLGMLATNVRPVVTVRSGSSLALKGAALVFMVVMLFTSGRIALATSAMQRVEQALKAGEPSAANVQLAEGFRLTPWDPVIRLRIAQLNWFDLSRDKEIRLMLMEGLKLEPFNYDFATMLGELSLRHADYDGAIAYMERALSMQPLRAVRYENLARVQVQAALATMPRDKHKGMALSQAVIQTHELFLSQRDELQRKTGFAFSEEFRLALGQALLIVGEHAQAETHLKLLTRSKVMSIQDTAAIALGRLYELTDRSKAAKPLLDRMAYRQDLNHYYNQLVNATR